MPKRLTQEEYVKKANSVHSEFYTYDKTIYTNAHSKITITCPVHGDFTQQACNHTNSGQGCPDCANNKPYTTDEFVSKAIIIHGTFYDYSAVVYSKAHEEVVIKCPIHGEFLQLPYVHIQGHHCPGCGKEATKQKNLSKENVWTYSGWEKAGYASPEFRGFSLYIVRCWNEAEEFIKVGKTFTDVSRRFRGTIPYQWELLYQKVGSADYISKLEHELHLFLSEHSIIPSQKFNGYLECYSNTVQEYISGFINSRTTSGM
jgi:hypothetical protein